MDEPEPDMVTDNSDIIENDEEAANLRRPFWALTFSGAAFLGLAIFILFARAPQTNTGISQDRAALIAAYQSILTETRTGVRLAQLESFVAENPNNRYALAARAQMAAL